MTNISFTRKLCLTMLAILTFNGAPLQAQEVYYWSPFVKPQGKHALIIHASVGDAQTATVYEAFGQYRYRFQQASGFLNGLQLRFTHQILVEPHHPEGDDGTTLVFNPEIAKSFKLGDSLRLSLSCGNLLVRGRGNAGWTAVRIPNSHAQLDGKRFFVQTGFYNHPLAVVYPIV